MQQRNNTPYPADTPGLELLSPDTAHTLRAAIADYRTPSAARARILSHIGRAAGEINAALALMPKVGPLHRLIRGDSE